MADLPSSQFFKEPGTGIASYVYPELYFHKLYKHSFSEIGELIDNIKNSDVPEARKEYEINRVYDIIRESRMRPSLMIFYVAVFICVLMILIFLITAVATGKPNYGFLGTGLLAVGVAAVYRYGFVSVQTEQYIDSFKQSHAVAHGKVNEYQDLQNSENMQFPKA